MTSNPNKSIFIGIDPGVTTGICIRTKTGSIELHEFEGHGNALFFIARRFERWAEEGRSAEVVMVIEDARLMKMGGGAFANARKQNVGYVKAFSGDWEKCAQNVFKCDLRMVSPMSWKKTYGPFLDKEGPRKGKVGPDKFKMLTGLQTMKGEQHLRDAYLISTC